MVGTDPRGQGGIAAVVRNYQASGLFDTQNVLYIATHRAGGVISKSVTAFKAMIGILISIVRLDRPLLHVHVASRASFWRKYVVCQFAKVFRRPYILHLHGAEFVEFYESECGPTAKRLIRGTLSRAAMVLALSSEWKERLFKICPGATIEILPNAVELVDLSLCTERRSNGQSLLVLFMGRLSRRKGTDELLTAFARIKPRFPAARLVCAGDGDTEAYKCRAADLGIGPHVDFPGWLNSQECRALLRSAAIFVLPSHAEGVPIAMLEAMSWQLPILSCPVGGIPEVVENGKNGLLVKAGDVNALADALDLLLRDADRRLKLGKEARATIELRYSLESSMSRLEQIYASFGVRL